ncbi:MAG: DNA/RNA non-specific endonuclease [Treponema sp.]|nr:DNA/RNA non-specific endonuclease [Treponema sp.]
MPKKRKSRKSKKQRHFLRFFLFIILILAALSVYSFKTNPEFRARVDGTIALITGKAESAISDTKQLIEGNSSNEQESAESEQEKSAPTEEKLKPEKKDSSSASQKSSGQKSASEKASAKELVALPAGLEKPICAASHKATDHQLRNFEHYSLCYRESYEQAEWSAYCLTEEELVKNAKRSDDFRSDPEITTGSATPSDYKKSGYDRGHLSPAADFAFDEKAMSETFYMSNMSPQKGNLNRGLWKDLESKVREWAEIFGRVYVVSGPILEKPAEEYNSIGENKVSVPEFYYKVLLIPLYEDEKDKETPEDAQSVTMLAFILPNEKCGEILDYYEVTVDEVEKRTGLDFFSLLEDSLENELEAKDRRAP